MVRKDGINQLDIYFNWKEGVNGVARNSVALRK